MCKKIIIFIVIVSCVNTLQANNNQPTSTIDISRDEIYDKIYGGWVGMLIGGLEGLPHEFKYQDEPRDSLPNFNYLPNGAETDDDNDFELTHIYFMDKENVLKLPYPRIAEIWLANMNTGIWAANEKARNLMREGLIPPATGSAKNNEFATFNLSAQFCTESYALISPGMPNTAANLGVYYAHISVCCEPIQATQFWTSLISMNMIKNQPIEKTITDALQAVDSTSILREVVSDALTVYHENPFDWKKARQLIYKKWSVERKWKRNSTPSNGAFVLLSLLYGNGDFYKTLQLAMALGLDADCNAATAGAIVGSKIGFKKMSALTGFNMPDRYVNKTRPQLPANMKISEQAELLTHTSEKVILTNGGKRIKINGKPGFRIKLQNPQVFEYLNK